jgi:2-oxoglutarate dehydrogenase E2 component (dihydrolipoamide succinyltransferase)
MAIVNIVLSEDQKEGTKAVVSSWLVTEGEAVEKNQPIVELETDKVMMEIVAPATGVLTKIIMDSGEEANDDQALGLIDSDAIADVKETAIIDKPKIVTVPSNPIEATYNSNNDFISPSVRRLVKQHHINLTQVQGSGKGNRITTRDIQAHLESSTQTLSTLENTSSEHLPITNMRRSIANHMVESLLHTAPHVTSVFNLDLSSIITHRKAHKEKFKQAGVNLTFTAYFIAASIAAIKAQPLINSQLHKETIEVFNNINIGIGAALEDGGLIVPVLKNCESRDLFAVAKELTKLTNKARSNKLKPNDVQGGTFTISNHGVSGSLIATPIIINQPQSAILGLGKMEKRVVVEELNGNDTITIKPMCYVTLTIDHRVLDAQQCNQFLSVFVETLENWK